MFAHKIKSARILELFFFNCFKIFTIKIILKMLNVEDKYLPIDGSYEKILNKNLSIKLNKKGICSMLWCLFKLSFIDIAGSAIQKLKISSYHRLS